ncbi:MAG: transglutaminase family protein [Nanoarchaeota archaeon]|nr:transglutaminase family protein [Nanoarchaeota archaeon]
MKQKFIEEQEDIEEPRKSPIWYIIGPILALLVILMVFPPYAIKLDPQPKDIPSLPEALPAQIYTMNVTQARHTTADLGKFDFSSDTIVKQVADKVAAKSCPSSKLCQAKALFYFTRDNIKYISDPKEYVKSPHETLLTGGGDCDDMAVLLLNLEKAIGVEAIYARSPNHLFVEIRIEDAPKGYQRDGWIPLDPTCKSCGFGETPYP